MYLSDNSNIVPVLIYWIFSPSWGNLFFLVFAFLVIFDWMLDKFYLVRCWVFLYSYKYFWTLFWNAVKSLGSSLILLKWQSMLNQGPLLRQDPSVYANPCSWIVKFSHLTRESRYSHSWVSSGNFPSIFWGHSSIILVVSSQVCTGHCSVADWKEPIGLWHSLPL